MNWSVSKFICILGLWIRLASGIHDLEDQQDEQVGIYTSVNELICSKFIYTSVICFNELIYSKFICICICICYLFWIRTDLFVSSFSPVSKNSELICSKFVC
jgi:hypothetical protein